MNHSFGCHGSKVQPHLTSAIIANVFSPTSPFRLNAAHRYRLKFVLVYHIVDRWRARPGSIFSLSLPGGAGSTAVVHHLSTILQPRVVGRCQGAFNALPVSQLPDATLRLYFEVVRWNPIQMKRPKLASEVGFSSDMVAISPRTVMREDPTGNSPVIAAESVQIGGLVEDQSLVLGMSSFGFSELQGMVAYQPLNFNLLYHIKDGVSLDLSIDEWEELPNMLQQLVENDSASGIFLDQTDAHFDMHVAIVEKLMIAGFVKQEGRKHLLTSLGAGSIVAASKLHSPIRSVFSFTVPQL